MLMLILHADADADADADTGADLADSGEEERAQGWRVLFLLLVLSCIIGLAMIVVGLSTHHHHH